MAAGKGGGGRRGECFRARPASGGRPTQLKSQLCHIMSRVGLGESLNLSEPLCKLEVMAIQGVIHAERSAKFGAQHRG